MEVFYIIAARDINGKWNKFTKAYDLPGLHAIPFFWDLEKAKHFLNNNLSDVKEFFSVFEIVVEDNKVKRIT